MERSKSNQLTPIKRGGMNDYPIWHGWRLLLKDLGFLPANILRRAELPSDLFTLENGTLETQQLFKLWAAVEAEAIATGEVIPLPLRIAKAMTADWFDPALFAALCSTDLNAALSRLSKYKRLVAPMTLQVDIRSEQTILSLEWLDKTVRPPSVLIAFELVFFVQLARLATRNQIRPKSLTCPIPLKWLSEYETYFGCKIISGSLPAVVFSAEDAQLPFLTSNHGMWLFFEPSLNKRLHELDSRAAMSELLKSAFFEAIPAGDVSLDSICKKLGVSSRTLQRRLNEEGSSFQKTLDQVRISLAFHYLAHSTMSGAEISFLLGFEDPSSFVRAFKTWTGTTPQAVRVAQPEVI